MRAEKSGYVKKISEKYDAGERETVDVLKQSLEDDRDGLYRAAFERDKVPPPSTIRKIGRFALDTVFRRPGAGSSKGRRRAFEAMSIALQEFDAEHQQKEEEHRDEQEDFELENPWGLALEQVEPIDFEEKEKETLRREMEKVRDELAQRKSERFQKQRIQEWIEQDLNKRLITLDDLESAIIRGDGAVEKHYIEYDNSNIPVYNLNGIPFAMLTHDIQYKEKHNQLSRDLVDDPSPWNDDEFTAKPGNASRGNRISMSYIDSGDNLYRRSGTKRYNIASPHICYGFSHVDSGSLILLADDDGGTDRTGSNKETSLNKKMLQVYDELHHHKRDRSGYYNEFLIRRYSETGQPRRPDYLIAEDGNISQNMLRHAAFFNIPILNINTKSYENDHS